MLLPCKLSCWKSVILLFKPDTTAQNHITLTVNIGKHIKHIFDGLFFIVVLISITNHNDSNIMPCENENTLYLIYIATVGQPVGLFQLTYFYKNGLQ